MSAFFVSINRDGSPYDPVIAENMMKAIEHYGVDDRHLVVQDNFALGYQSLWTVPEEQGERQPLYDSASQTWLVFYGRIDNREALCKRLALSDFAALSDAALLQAYLGEFGESHLSEVLGPFSFVYYSPKSAKLLAARDAMGGRNLVFAIDDSHIHIASDEMALVGHPSIEYRFNRGKLGRVIAQMMQDRIAGTIDGVKVVAPGDLLKFDGRQLCRNQFYRCNGSARIKLANDAAYAAEFRRLLEQAVRRRSRSIGPLGSMMSGGMDSVPISISLAQQLAASGQQLTAFSWVYNRYPEADEREYSAPVCEDFGIEQVCIDCDDVWPQLDESTHQHPLLPFAIPYSEYQQVLMAEVQARGIRTLITGIYGDLLYGHTSSVFLELLRQCEWRKLFTELRLYWQQPSTRSYLIKHGVLAQLPGMQRLINWRRNRRELRADYLQEHINDQIFNQTPDLFYESLAALRPETYRHVFSGFAGEDQALGRHMETKYHLERRYPFRDRDLCEFMLAIPSEQLQLAGVPRPIVKNAYESEFRPELLARNDKTDFTSAVVDGIRNDQNWRKWHGAAQPKWREYVKDCDIQQNLSKNSDLDVVHWRCGYYDYWKSVCYNRVAKELGLTNDND